MAAFKGTNREVAEAWIAGLHKSSHNGNYRTDGVHLWSYALLIGKRDDQGKPLLLDVTGLISPRTSDHVREAWFHGPVTAVRPAVDLENLSVYTRYSFPTGREGEVIEHMKPIIRYAPERLRPAFDRPENLEVNNPLLFKLWKLPSTVKSVFLSTLDEDKVHERVSDPRLYRVMWMSDDCWTYTPAVEEKVLLSERAADDGDRYIYTYWLTMEAGGRGWPYAYQVHTYIYRVWRDRNDKCRIALEDEALMLPARDVLWNANENRGRLEIYRGGVHADEFKTLLISLSDYNERTIRVVERDTQAYRTIREKLLREGR
jgi:hypothetical protein